jgi:hypothetical protein
MENNNPVTGNYSTSTLVTYRVPYDAPSQIVYQCVFHSGMIGYINVQDKKGYTGSKGDLGYSGSQGVTGFIGSQGVTGFVGSQGYSGGKRRTSTACARFQTTSRKNAS